MTRLHSFVSLPSGLTLDENALTVFSKQSETRLWLQLDGDRECVIDNPVDVHALRPRILKRAAVWMTLDQDPTPLYMDPEAVVSVQPTDS